MPPRKKAKKGRHHTQLEEDTQECESSLQIATLPQLKCGLTQLPAELQLQIYSHIGLRDLYNLARTCSDLRHFCLDRSTERLWATAHRNSPDLPKCPSSMSMPAFAHLLFSRTCQECGRGGVSEAVWPWLVRCCLKCLGKQAYTLHRARDLLNDLDPLLLDREAKRQLTDYEKAVIGDLFCVTDIARGQGVQKARFDSFVAEYSRLPRPVAAATRSQIVSKQTARTKALSRLRAILSRWSNGQRRAEEIRRQQQYEVQKERRFVEIIENLKHTGWGEEIDLVGSESIREQMLWKLDKARASTVTERDWERAIKAAESSVQAIRKERYLQRLKPRFAKLYDVMVSHLVPLPRTIDAESNRPNFLDLAPMDECRSLVDVPATEEIAPQRYDEVVAAAALRWMTERKREIGEVLSPHVGDVADGVDIADLAISVFVCCGFIGQWRRDDGSVCLLRYPGVLGHKCLRPYEDETGADSYAGAVRSFASDRDGYRRSEKYASTFSVVDHEDTAMVVRKMRAIVVGLGLDPRCATFDELQRSDRRVRCLKCVEEGREDNVYTWEAALSHSLLGPKGWKSQYIIPLHDFWELVPEDQMQRVRQLEKAAHAEPVEQGDWFCALCYHNEDGWNPRRSDIYKHLVTSHKIKEPEDIAHKNGLCFSLPSHHCGRGIHIRSPVPYLNH
ncbi:hypothetical protein C8Q80DRAFT_1208008 [Daedaleopsis nitida]|nr:hypothetical protein C8Q80DRAFT_1208008 [Daedaleopsis nitida]